MRRNSAAVALRGARGTTGDELGAAGCMAWHGMAYDDVPRVHVQSSTRTWALKSSCSRADIVRYSKSGMHIVSGQ